MKNKEAIKSDITFIEACKMLGKSKRTVSRYIKAGKLNPERIKSQKGFEYRFSQSEIESFKKPDTTGQMTRQNIFDDKNNDTLSLLNDTMKLLQKQLKAKDTQIKQLLERQRETNILMGQLQNKVLMLEDKSKDKRPDKNNRTDDTTSQVKWQGINDFFKRLFKGTQSER
jgi:excisionase family DNA binding protein